MKLDRVYYISQGQTTQDHLINIENACIAGCKLIQLRLKDVSTKEFILAANAAKGICLQFGAMLIINDNVEVAIKTKANGIHVGKNDMAPSEIKNLFPEAIIGGTANTLEDCLELISQDVDYIGLGPFRFTETKKKLSPILGIAGYSRVVSALNNQGFKTSVYAIGGITPSDTDSIYQTGVYGIAVSGIMSGHQKKSLKEVYNNLQPKIETV